MKMNNLKQASDFEKIALSNILHEIKDISLQQTLRDILFSDYSVIAAIRKNRPETKLADLTGKIL